jgi:hypothetical protein
MEKKARVKRLNHQDDVKRSWAAAYQLEENLLEENVTLEEDEQEEQADLDPNDPDPETQPFMP